MSATRTQAAIHASILREQLEREFAHQGAVE